MQRILRIPVKNSMEDLLAWHYDKKGLFSVKSAYHVLDDGRKREQSGQQRESSSNSGGCYLSAGNYQKVLHRQGIGGPVQGVCVQVVLAWIPAVGHSGGMLLGIKEDCFELINEVSRTFSQSVTIYHKDLGHCWELVKCL